MLINKSYEQLYDSYDNLSNDSEISIKVNIPIGQEKNDYNDSTNINEMKYDNIISDKIFTTKSELLLPKEICALIKNIKKRIFI